MPTRHHRYSYALGAPLALIAMACTLEPEVNVGDLGTASTDDTTPSPAPGASGDATGGLPDPDPEGDDTTTAATTPAPASSGDDADPPVLLDVGSDELPTGCAAEAASSMTVLDEEGVLYRFDPDTLELEPLGPLECPDATLGVALTSDRSDTLWVMMVDELGYRLIYTVDPQTLDCAATPFVDPFESGFTVFSLAFVADEPGSDEETLYISGLDSAGLDPDAPGLLGRIESRETMAVTEVGTMPVPNSPYYEIADLSGTGDARLFGLFASDPGRFTEIETSDASLIEDQITDFPTGSSWSFAQWAGQIYVFTATAPNGNSEVRIYDPDQQTHALAVEDLGVRVSGAAVSTCAPFEPAG